MGFYLDTAIANKYNKDNNNAGSSNGRTVDFGSAYRGSNPCPAAQFNDKIKILN